MPIVLPAVDWEKAYAADQATIDKARANMTKVAKDAYDRYNKHACRTSQTEIAAMLPLGGAIVNISSGSAIRPIPISPSAGCREGPDPVLNFVEARLKHLALEVDRKSVV